MKNILLLFTVFTYSLYAQDYNVFLNNAINAVENNNENEYKKNIKIFSIAIENRKITPENISQEYYNLFYSAISAGIQKGYNLNPKTVNQALHFMENHASKYNDDTSMNNLGHMYLEARGTEVNYKRAYYWLSKASQINPNNDAALNGLGTMYRDGKFVDIDSEKSKNYFQKSAELGNIYAMNNLGYYYLNQGTLSSYKQALYWFNNCAELNEPVCYNNLGHIFLNGYGVEPNIEKAIQFFKSSAELNNSFAMLNLGFLYNNLNDFDKSNYWYKRAANLGNVNAMTDLALKYELGLGIEKNDEFAFQWMKKAAEKGHVDARLNLAFYYANGVGTQVNNSHANEIFIEIAQMGHKQGMYIYGARLLDGIGVEKDEIEAKKWLKKACDLQVVEACTILYNEN